MTIVLIAVHENLATSNNSLTQHITLLTRFDWKDSNFEGMQSIYYMDSSINSFLESSNYVPALDSIVSQVIN
jgi:hypothetical protein